MSEFKHYSNHPSSARHADNCGACALENPVMINGRMVINYAAWPLSYMRYGRRIPHKFMRYLLEELESNNLSYVENLKKQLIEHGYNIDVIRKRME